MSTEKGETNNAVRNNPPSTISFSFCPICGRDDRYSAFLGKEFHYAGGSRCFGQIKTVTYVLLSKRDIEAGP